VRQLQALLDVDDVIGDRRLCSNVALAVFSGVVLGCHGWQPNGRCVFAVQC
jgi:hypothetical protein